jgi:predicted NUDIX family NTP pyrophosphohydrolase
MASHQFVERNESPLLYRLIFDKRRVVRITLPAPAFFDQQAKGRYTITRVEADEYERRAEAARRHAAAQEAINAASQYDPSYTYGYPPGHP